MPDGTLPGLSLDPPKAAGLPGLTLDPQTLPGGPLGGLVLDPPPAALPPPAPAAMPLVEGETLPEYGKPTPGLSALFAAPPPPPAPMQGPPQPLNFSDPATAAAGFTPAETPGTASYAPLQALGAGATAATTELGQTAQGQAFTLQPGAQPEPQRGFVERTAYGIGHSYPTLALGAAGMAGGAALGGPAAPITGILGGAGGLALGSLVQDLMPAYQAVRLAHPEMSHEDAVNYAWKHAAVAGAAGGISGLILPYAPPFVKSAVGRILFQTFVAQPAVGAGARTVSPMVTGEPMPDNDAYLSGYFQDVATGLALSGTHALVRGAADFRPRRDEILPPLPYTRPQLEGPLRGLPQGPPTIDMEPSPAGPQPAGPGPVVSDEPRSPAGTQAQPLARGGPQQGGPVAQTEPQPAPAVATPAQAAAVLRGTQSGPVPLPGVTLVPPSPAPSPGPPPPPASTDQPSPHPYATVEIRPNPGGGFDIETPLEGIQHAATMEEAQRLQARYTRLDGEQAARYEQLTGRNYADDWRNNEVDAATVQRVQEGAPVDRSRTTITPREPVPAGTPQTGEGGPPGVVTSQEPGRPDGEGAAAGGPPGDQRTQPATTVSEPTPSPAAVSEPAGEVTPAKRPVTQNEWDDLNKRYYAAQRELNNAKTPEKTATAQQKVDTLRAEIDRSERPPIKGTPAFGGGGPVTREQARENANRRAAEHQALVDAHTAAINKRVYDEGKAPAPEPKKAGDVFSMGGPRGQKINSGTDSQGQMWVGNSNVMTHASVLNREVNSALKRSTTTQAEVSATALDSITKPDPKAKLETINWERQVTHPDGTQLVVGTLPDGTHVTLKKPIYDALHKAAGPNGSLVTTNKKNGDRVFARAPDGTYPGVGMPINIPQDQARTYARGPEKPAVAAAKAVRDNRGDYPAPTQEEPVVPGPAAKTPSAETQAAPGEDIKPPSRTSPLEKLSTEPDTENPNQFVAHDSTGRGVAIGDTPEHALDLARWRGEPMPAGIRAKPGLTTEPDHESPGQFVAKNAEGHIEAIGDSPEHALQMAQLREDTQPGGGLGTTGPGKIGTQAKPQDAYQDQGITQGITPSEQLKNLYATRDDLMRPGRVLTPRESQRLGNLHRQIAGKERAEGIEAERKAGRKQPFPGPPQVGLPKKFLDYKFNDGASVWRSVFEQAGYDPDTALSQSTAWQHKVLSEHMKTLFGFRDVTVTADSSPVEQHLAVHAMLDMTRAIQDMMASLGQPLDVASLDGFIHNLEIEPAGKRNYFGQYEPGTRTLRVVGGANSFGHEWIHALDHFLADQLVSNPAKANELLTRYAQRDQLDPKDGIQGAFARVMNTLFYDDAARALREIDLISKSNQTDRLGNPTAVAIKAQQDLKALERANLRLKIQPSAFREAAGKYGFKPRYLMDPVELLARAGEAYISRQMVNNMVDPRGVVMPDQAYLDESDRALRMLYPSATEQMAFFKAFDDLFHEIRKADILGRGKPAASFPNLGILDPAHFATTTPQLTPAQIRANRAAFNSWANRTKAIITGQALFDPTRPAAPAGLPLSTRLADQWGSILLAHRTIMRTVAERSPEPAKAALHEIRDRLTTAPGEGRQVPENIEEARDRYMREDGRRYSNYVRNAGFNPAKLEKITPEEDAMIRHVMISGEKTYPPDPNNPQITKPIPPELVTLGGRLRDLLDTIWHRLHNAGIDIGYTDRYFPRIYDRHAIFADQPGFTTQAKKAYSLLFDREMGAPGSDPAALLEKWTTLSRQDRALRPGGNTDLPGRMSDLAKNLRQQRDLEEKTILTPAEQTELARLKAEARQMAVDAHDLLREHVTSLEADNWYARLSEPNLHNFDTTGIGGGYLNARTLPPEADLLMRDYMHTSITDAIPQYIKSAAHRAADAERFGPAEEDYKKLISLARKGGTHPDDLQWFMDSVATIRGTDKVRATRTHQLMAYIHAASSMALMGRVVYTALSEPMYAYAVTGRARDGMRTFVYQLGSLLSLGRSEGARARTEFAELLGVSQAAGFDSIMNSRQGVNYDDDPWVAQVMTKYYRTVGLTSLVNSQRAAGAAAMHWFIHKTALDYLNQGTGTRAKRAREDAIAWFNEWGIPPEPPPVSPGQNEPPAVGGHTAFAKWIVSLGGQRPTSQQLRDDPMGMAYGLANRRLMNRVNQDPKIANRAAGSNTTRFPFLFQLMSFNYSIGHNVISPLMDTIFHRAGQARRLAEEAGSGPTAAKAKGFAAGIGATIHVAAAMAAIMVAAVPGLMLKLAIFDPERLKKILDNADWSEIFDQAWSRAGLNAQGDPIIQILNQTKYDADVSSLAEGTGPNWIIKGLNDILTAAKAGASETNTAIFNATRAVYNLIGVPIVSYLLSQAGNFGGVPGRIAGGTLLQYLTSPGAVKDITEATVGSPKGAKSEEAGAAAGDEPPTLVVGMPTISGLEGEGGADDASKDQGLSGGSNVLAFGDDIMMPMWRKIGPILSAAPRPLKLGIVGAAAAYGAYKYLGATERFRGQPAPEPKE